MNKFYNKNKKIFITIILITAILTIIVAINNIVKNNKISNQNYFSTIANANSNLVAGYIKKGISIGGITGTFEVLNTADATATAEDIDWGKTAYVNGVKITGTRIPDNNYTFTDSYGNKVKVPRRL